MRIKIYLTNEKYSYRETDLCNEEPFSMEGIYNCKGTDVRYIKMQVEECGTGTGNLNIAEMQVFEEQDISSRSVDRIEVAEGSTIISGDLDSIVGQKNPITTLDTNLEVQGPSGEA